MNKLKRVLSVVAIALLMIGSISSAQVKSHPVTNGNRSKKKIALTFDDGPRSGNTDKILKILKDKGVKATFFVLGSYALSHKAIIKTEVSDGHEIGYHTWSHKWLSRLSEAGQNKEISTGLAKLEELADTKIRFMRPPYGAYNKSTLRATSKLDLTTVLWDIDTRDWSKSSSTSSIRRELSKVRSGSIVLFHDGLKTHTPEVLVGLIDRLQTKGYEFVTLSELLLEEKTK